MTTLEMLLNQLANQGGQGLPNPAPSANIPLITQTGQPNVPEYGGPSQVTEPPQAPLDPRIIQQYLAAQGPAPTPPAPLGRGQRIANALMGFGAGVQGSGPQFLAQLQEPQRRYEAQVQDYNANRERLRLGGTEAMLREQERKTERAQRLSDQQFELEAQREARRLGISDQRDFELFRNDLLAARQKADDERQYVRETAKQAAQQKLKFSEDVAAQVRWYKSQGVDERKNPGAARRLALNDLAEVAAQLGVAVPALSRSDNQQLQLVATRIARMQGAGGTGGGKLMAQLQNGQVVPASLVNREAGGVMLNGQLIPVVGYTGGNISNRQSQPAAPPGVKGQSPQGFPLALGQPGGPQRRSEAAPKLNNQQRGRFNDIRKHQPGYSDAQVLEFMRQKGWLK